VDDHRPRRSVDRHSCSVGDRCRRAVDAYRSRDTELASHDRRVTLLCSDVDHDTCHREKERSPRGVGDGRDEDVVRAQVTRPRRVDYDACGAGGDARTDSNPMQSTLGSETLP
jgi:hypothetical protein